MNGKTRTVQEGATIRQLLEEVGLHPQRVAVQLNMDIIKRDRYESVTLKPGDAVEILTFMAGG